MTKARDISKLSAVEVNATGDQTDAEVKAAVEAASDSNTFTDADHSKLNAIEASADVTDTANVTSSGALMDSELTNLAAVKAINQSLVTTADAAFASLDISGNIDVDGTTNLDVVDIDGAVDMASTLAVTGVVTANAGVVVDNFTLDGTTLALSSGDMTLDVAGNITLDADDAGEIRLKDGGTQYGALKIDSSRFKIQSIISDADMLFAGNDGGSEITALTLDMSAAGAATFNSALTTGGNLVVNADANTTIYLGNGGTNAAILKAGAGDELYIGANDTYAIRVLNDGTNNVVFDNSSNVGIGTASPNSYSGQTALTINSTGVARLDLDISDTLEGYLISESGYVGLFAKSGGSVIFGNASERMRIDASGNLLVGTTDDTLYNNTSGSGIMLAASGRIDVARVQDVCAILNRTGASDGSIINFAKNGTTVGSIACRSSGGNLQIHTVQSGIDFGGDGYLPMRGATITDDNLDIGSGSFRYDDIYATNGTIQTSDFNEKQDIAALTSTEMLVAKRISTLFKTFRWKSKVAAKGDNARTHTGIIAQDVQAAFTAEGLDAGDYSLFISSTWLVDSEGNVVEEGTEGAVSKTRMGIRYPELLSFVAAYNEQRFANIEARITALEA